MLTFSEMLVLLKSGEDMRHDSWPRGTYLRALITDRKQEARKITGRTRERYSPTQQELFDQGWEKA